MSHRLHLRPLGVQVSSLMAHTITLTRLEGREQHTTPSIRDTVLLSDQPQGCSEGPVVWENTLSVGESHIHCLGRAYSTLSRPLL